MASVNKYALGEDLLRRLYVDDLKSIPIISKEISVPQSTVRYWLKEFGLLRDRADAVRIAAKQGRIGQHLKGIKRVFTKEWKENISSARRRLFANSAKGITKKQNGYIEHTTGENKGRLVHITIMEKAIGRRLSPGEVVHHVDHKRSNNELENLVLMSRSDHASMHAQESYLTRTRNENGQFE